MKPGLSHIVFVLDRSGSMQSMCREAVVSYNQFIKDQKEVPGEATFHLILFNTVEDDVYKGNIQGAPELTEERYNPINGTALYDAMAHAILLTGEVLKRMDESNRPSKVIVTTMTDGEENSSTDFRGEYGRQRLAEMIKHQTEKYGWEFIFLGANIDAPAMAMSLNIPVANTEQWDSNTIHGVTTGFAANSGMVTRSRAGSH